MSEMFAEQSPNTPEAMARKLLERVDEVLDEPDELVVDQRVEFQTSEGHQLWLRALYIDQDSKNPENAGWSRGMQITKPAPFGLETLFKFDFEAKDITPGQTRSRAAIAHALELLSKTNANAATAFSLALSIAESSHPSAPTRPELKGHLTELYSGLLDSAQVTTEKVRHFIVSGGSLYFRSFEIEPGTAETSPYERATPRREVSFVSKEGVVYIVSETQDGALESYTKSAKASGDRIEIIGKPAVTSAEEQMTWLTIINQERELGYRQLEMPILSLLKQKISELR